MGTALESAGDDNILVAQLNGHDAEVGAGHARGTGSIDAKAARFEGAGHEGHTPAGVCLLAGHIRGPHCDLVDHAPVESGAFQELVDDGDRKVVPSQV